MRGGFPPAADGQGTAAPRAQWARPADPTVRWGDTLALRFLAGGQLSAAGDFMRVTLPTPRVCSLTFNAFLSPNPGAPLGVVVQGTLLEIFVGLGSARYSRRYGFSMLPTLGSELNFIEPHLALQTLYVRATGTLDIGAAASVDLIITGQLAPIAPLKEYEAPTGKRRAAETLNGEDDDEDDIGWEDFDEDE
jgi:hypothetical protein